MNIRTLLPAIVGLAFVAAAAHAGPKVGVVVNLGGGAIRQAPVYCPPARPVYYCAPVVYPYCPTPVYSYWGPQVISYTTAPAGYATGIYRVPAPVRLDRAPVRCGQGSVFRWRR